MRKKAELDQEFPTEDREFHLRTAIRQHYTPIRQRMARETAASQPESA